MRTPRERGLNLCNTVDGSQWMASMQFLGYSGRVLNAPVVHTYAARLLVALENEAAGVKHPARAWLKTYTERPEHADLVSHLISDTPPTS